VTERGAWARVAFELGPEGPELVVDLVGARPVGIDAADALARLVLAVRRAGGRVRVVEIDPAFAEILELAGLRGQVGW
jgi:anti-anti-sigma regulatory factor